MHINWKSPFRLALELSRVAVVRMAGKSATVTPEIFKTRIKICEKCQYFDDRQCVKCTCFMDVKAWLTTARCPDKKWLQTTKFLEGIKRDIYSILLRSALILQSIIPRV